MDLYNETFATVTNDAGASVTVPGPLVVEWAPLADSWKRTYRPVMIEEAISQGLSIAGGVRVTWSRSEEAF